MSLFCHITRGQEHHKRLEKCQQLLFCAAWGGFGGQISRRCLLPSSPSWPCLLCLGRAQEWSLSSCSLPLLNAQCTAVFELCCHQVLASAAASAAVNSLLPNTEEMSVFALGSWPFCPVTAPTFSMWWC